MIYHVIRSFVVCFLQNVSLPKVQFRTINPLVIWVHEERTLEWYQSEPKQNKIPNDYGVDRKLILPIVIISFGISWPQTPWTLRPKGPTGSGMLTYIGSQLWIKFTLTL